MRALTGQRFARSFLTPVDVQVVEAELDFQLGPSMAIVIDWVQAYLAEFSWVASAVWLPYRWVQTLHLETGPLEDVPVSAGEDEQNVDSEIFYAHAVAALGHDTAVAVGGSASGVTQGNTVMHYREPVVSVRNITHRAEGFTVGGQAGLGVLIAYKYVELTKDEFVLNLAKRS